MRYHIYPSWKPTDFPGLKSDNLRYRWKGEEGIPAYVTDPDEEQPPAVLRPIWAHWEHAGVRRWDYKARTYPHMQDMIRTSGSHGYFAIGDGESDLGPVSADNGLGRVCLKESETSFRAYHPDYLFQSFFQAGSGNGQGQIQYQPEGTIGSSRDLYDRLANPLTKWVSLTRNPFDTQFNIWMLGQDLVQLPKLIAGGFEVIAKIRKLRYGTHILGLPYRDVMNGDLARRFGLLPTLQDLRDFIAIVKKWGELLEQDGATTGYFTYRRPVREIDRMKTYTRSYNFQDGGCRANLSMTYTTGILRLYMLVKYYFVCPELHGLMARIKKGAHVLGLTGIPEAAWDRVPFSFVVDWFTDLGGWLHRNAKPNWYPVDLIITDWAETLIRDTDYVGHLTFEGPDILKSSTAQDCWHTYTNKEFVKGVIHQYARKRQFPAPLVVSRKNLDLGLKQSFLRVNRVIVGSCLVGQHSKSKYRYYLSGRYIKRARIN